MLSKYLVNVLLIKGTKFEYIPDKQCPPFLGIPLTWNHLEKTGLILILVDSLRQPVKLREEILKEILLKSNCLNMKRTCYNMHKKEAEKKFRSEPASCFSGVIYRKYT